MTNHNKRQEVVNKIISLLEQTDISKGYPNLYQRIKEWIDEIPIEKVHDGDLVSRKDAIDALRSLPRWIIDNNGEFQPVDVNTESMLDPEDAVSAIENLPSAQSGIINCCDCRWGHAHNADGTRICEALDDLPMNDNDFCSRAERREE